MKLRHRYPGAALSTATALLLVACTTATTSPATIQIRLVPDQTQTVEITANQTLIAEIEGNLTTGYHWELMALTRERRCYIFKELASESIVGNFGQPDLMGAPSVQKWSIKIDPDFPCSKDQPISWTYRRSWEPLNSQDKTTRIILKPVSESPSTLR
jgi:predicted secreted protein